MTRHRKARRESGGWLDRAPTIAEVRAHHAAHSTQGGYSLWVFWAAGAKVPMFHYSTGTEVPHMPLGTTTGRWRPLDAEAVACQLAGGEDD